MNGVEIGALIVAGIYLLGGVTGTLAVRGDRSSGALGVLLLCWGWPVLIPYMAITEAIDLIRRRR